MFGAACASQSAPDAQEGARRPRGDTCSSAVAPDVSAAISARLARTSNVLEYENAWKNEHPGTASGSISGSEVRARIRANLGQIQGCYESALQRGGEGGGRVVVRFVIGASGEVAAAHIGDSFGDPEVACCVVKRVANWRFPKPSAGEFVAVEYPFVVRLSRAR